MKRVSFILALVLIIAILAGCAAAATPTTTTTTTTTVPTTTATTTPIQQLSATENIIFEALVIGLENFYNMTEAKILACSALNEKGTCFIKIQGTNKMGGTLTHVYATITSGDSKGTMMTRSDMSKALGGGSSDQEWDLTPDPTINVGNLNRALDYKWKQMGLK